MPDEKWTDIRNRYESSFIETNEEYLLHPSVKNFDMGLGWSRCAKAAEKVVGFEWECSRGTHLDVSVVLLNKDLELVDVVWYRQLLSVCGSVKCLEKREKATEGTDDFVVSVDLAKLPLNVHHLLFCVSNYNHSFASNDVLYLQAPVCSDACWIF